MPMPMPLPLPGSPVRGSKTGAPIMALFDLLGRRWAMGIVWQLNAGPASFRALQQRCESVSPSVLNTRLAELRAAGLVQRVPEGYGLSAHGAALYGLLAPLGLWARDWAARLDAAGEAPL